MRNMQCVIVAVLACLLAFATSSSAQGDRLPKAGDPGKATVISDPQNVVASELVGVWTTHKDLSVHLGSMRADSNEVDEIEFRANEESKKLICSKLESMLATVREKKGAEVADALQVAMQRIYWAGELEWRTADEKQLFPAVLIVWRGNPQVMMYRNVNGRDDLEQGNVMLARDLKGDNDLLFIGGDFNNESFRAFRRKPKAAAEEKPAEGK